MSYSTPITVGQPVSGGPVMGTPVGGSHVGGAPASNMQPLPNSMQDNGLRNQHQAGGGGSCVPPQQSGRPPLVSEGQVVGQQQMMGPGGPAPMIGFPTMMSTTDGGPLGGGSNQQSPPIILVMQQGSSAPGGGFLGGNPDIMNNRGSLQSPEPIIMMGGPGGLHQAGQQGAFVGGPMVLRNNSSLSMNAFGMGSSLNNNAQQVMIIGQTPGGGMIVANVRDPRAFNEDGYQEEPDFCCVYHNSKDPRACVNGRNCNGGNPCPECTANVATTKGKVYCLLDVWMHICILALCMRISDRG